MTNPDEIKEVAIIGLGTMGAVIAQVFAQNGYRVKGYEAHDKALQTAQKVIQMNVGALRQNENAEINSVDKILANIQYADSIAEAVDCADIVIEAVNENKEIKEKVYRDIDAGLPANSKILSNTSTLNIFPLMCERRLEHTIIAHWFAPPHIIPLIEVVKGEQTSAETVALTMALMEKLGKVPVLIEKYIPGFVINRILRILGREAFFLIEEGVITPAQLDLAIKASIAPRMMVLGLMQRYDFTGLDLSARNLQDKEFFDPPLDNEPEPLVSRVKKGDLGVKTGRGFYDYGDRKIEEILRERDIHLSKVLKETAFCYQKKRLV